MPDSSTASRPRRFDEAVAVVEAWLASLPGSTRTLNITEVRKYSRHNFAKGWRLEVQGLIRVFQLDLLITNEFPRAAPKISLVNRPKFLTYPHIEKDGVLCLLPNSAEVDVDQPIHAVSNILASAATLLEDLEGGKRTEDFRSEFLSYWNAAAKEDAVELTALVTPAEPSRTISIWYGKEQFIAADTAEELVRWLQNRSNQDDHNGEIHQAFFLWLNKALLPHEYPNFASEVFALARDLGASDELKKNVAQDTKRLVVLFGMPTDNGPALAGCVILPPLPGKHSKQSSLLSKGFRPGNLPREILLTRFFGGNTIQRIAVNRGDSSWIHGRGHDPYHRQVRKSRIVLIGCGSVGSSLATKMAEAGVGELVLIDPEILVWANIGRHELGAKYVGGNKAQALRHHLRERFPHMVSVEAHARPWQQALEQTSTLFDGCHVIVSAVGSWGVEGALNEWHLRSGRTIPIVYTWMEPHATAGHAVAISKLGGCLQCGFSSHGNPHLRITSWPEDTTTRQEPACGAIFQPYGPIELASSVALAAELVLDCAIGTVPKSVHRIWIGSARQVKAAGGGWNPEWETAMQGRSLGRFVEERAWVANTACTECGEQRGA